MNKFDLNGGHTIEFNHDYHRYHTEVIGHKIRAKGIAREWAEQSINIAGGAEKIDYDYVSKKFRKSLPSLSITGYVSTVIRNYQMLELFRDSRFPPPHGRTLDIGCGRGTNLRLLKAWGIISESVGVDIVDYCSNFDSASLNKLQQRFKLLRYVEWIQNRISLTPEEDRTPIQKAIMENFPTVRQRSQFHGHRPDMGIYNMTFKVKPTVDKLIIGNVYDIIDERFDLITSFATVDWLTVNEIMPKVSSMLTDGGFFYMWVGNWWENINTTNIFGHFPFTLQRMNKEEFTKYARETSPEISDSLLTRYSYFDPQHPTLSDYVEVAAKSGLIPLNWKENIIPNTLAPSGAVTSLGVAELDQDSFYSAWTDAKIHRPELRLTDLYSKSHSILFYKPKVSEGLDYETLTCLRAKQGFSYLPTSTAGKIAKSFGKTLLELFKNKK